jgi:hypothetical protein
VRTTVEATLAAAQARAEARVGLTRA